MFISATTLGIEYGVDDKIASFFVDREPPPDNLYWNGRYLYLQPSSGYLFIPLIIDLLSKTGIDKKELLSEEFVTCMEQIGHASALEETKQITPDQTLQSCITIAQKYCKNEKWLATTIDYFSQVPANLIGTVATPFKALHRGDFFLFSMSALEFGEDLFVKIAQVWFALISSLLVMDDVEDLHSDKRNNEVNSLLESGLNKEGIERIEELMKHNFSIISAVNYLMAKKLDNEFSRFRQKLTLN